MIAVIKKREHHIRPPERGYATCGQCGSDLSADRSDFKRPRSFGAEGHLSCPVCGVSIGETSFRWHIVDEAVEEKAKRAHGDSQNHLHNLHYVSWEEASEETRESWRARVR